MRVIGMSYTLNGEQPIFCSYVGSEPLFSFKEEEVHKIPKLPQNLRESIAKGIRESWKT